MQRSIARALGLASLLLLAPASAARAGIGGTVALESANLSVNEADGAAVITVKRLAGDDGAISVSYRTLEGSAVQGVDYTQVGGTVRWPDGDDSDRTFTIPIVDDEEVEPGETLTIELFSPTGGVSLGDPSTATLTIVDDDVTDPGEPMDCTADATTLCLQQGRFRVTSRWRRTNGATGDGMAVTLTSDTGYFWFFNEANVEMIVKVLRGCNNNGHYWVFAGGLTNVEVDLRVEDTSGETERLYLNVLETPFQPIQDVTAFASCP